eukprot:gnl/Chilomastix_cuspidata/5547.p1 GENE.gnl/Chilomastix_cuspidata/5547~~gnl/Chilomastix_cuspidata/5547.p1  ORF type:complete len:191 (-),score=45.23 gnl/Chilomastix_cuspidata/5547:63-635(-)
MALIEDRDRSFRTRLAEGFIWPQQVDPFTAFVLLSPTQLEYTLENFPGLLEAHRATILDLTAPSAACRFLFSFFTRRGYFLTPGAKFGGQFLAYRAPPPAAHAEYVVAAHDGASVSGADLLRYERAAHAVHKRAAVGLTLGDGTRAVVVLTLDMELHRSVLGAGASRGWRTHTTLPDYWDATSFAKRAPE